MMSLPVETPPPKDGIPPHVRLASGWYASYWNAFLFQLFILVSSNIDVTNGYCGTKSSHGNGILRLKIAVAATV